MLIFTNPPPKVFHLFPLRVLYLFPTRYSCPFSFLSWAFSFFSWSSISPEKGRILWWKNWTLKAQSQVFICSWSWSPVRGIASKMLLTRLWRKYQKQWSLRWKCTLLYSVVQRLDSLNITTISASWMRKTFLTSKDAFPLLRVIPAVLRAVGLKCLRIGSSKTYQTTWIFSTTTTPIWERIQMSGMRLLLTWYHAYLIWTSMRKRSTTSLIIWPTMNQDLLFLREFRYCLLEVSMFNCSGFEHSTYSILSNLYVIKLGCFNFPYLRLTI